MTNDWHELTDLTADRRFLVTEVRMDSGISVNGEFELPAAGPPALRGPGVRERVRP